ncbi:hypothetical protein [uncultured Algibacter sp.]|uniref:hypothetical protein n=1 Tax=uncultured Algibacter sp. TaxID=298659 RepID=UPI002603E1A8|nr:hypothetical protein [uncultured Algibacter sp.]
MTLKKWHKITIISLVIITTIGLIYYFNLSNRYKAIVKTRALHFFKIIDSEWSKSLTDNYIKFQSPSLLIDGIYKSMEGPNALQNFYLNQSKQDLLWMTGFKIEAVDSKTNDNRSNDFVCHTNIDYIEQEHHGRWNMLDRINKQYPRVISLSHGVESVKFPEGYGFPFFSDEQFFIITQALNHNINDSIFQIKHDISIAYSKKRDIKPLLPRTIFMMLPFDINDPFNSEGKMMENSCIPIETKNHTYFDKNGQALSGHWKIFEGEQTFSYNATEQLAIKDTMRLHQVTPHLHPFAKQFILKDLTSGEVIYNCDVINHKNKIGLTKTPEFSSKEGVLMYPNHEYELTLVTDNTTNEVQDMMASMFLFFYDKEMDLKINTYYDAQ